MRARDESRSLETELKAGIKSQHQLAFHNRFLLRLFLLVFRSLTGADSSRTHLESDHFEIEASR